mgnify:CR=1 FL=1
MQLLHFPYTFTDGKERKYRKLWNLFDLISEPLGITLCINSLGEIFDIMTDDSLDSILIHVVLFGHGDEVLPAIVGLMLRVKTKPGKDILIVHPEPRIAYLAHFTFCEIRTQIGASKFDGFLIAGLDQIEDAGMNRHDAVLSRICF